MGNALPSLRLGAVSLGLAIAFAIAGPAAAADDPPEVAMKQLKLTDKQVTDFIAAQPELAKITDKLEGTDGPPNPATQSELEGVAKKHGFADFSEFYDIASNISLIMAGLDPKSDAFTEPVEGLAKELDKVKADTALPEADKKQLVHQLTEAIKSTPKVEFRENIDIVKAHRPELEKVMQ